MKKLLILMILFPLVCFGQTRPHWLQIQDKPYVDIREHGAIATPTFDNTAAIQAAVDFAVSNKLWCVYIPPGEWRLSGTINLPGNVDVRGAARDTSTLYLTSWSSTDAIFRRTSGGTQTIEGLTLRGPSRNAGSTYGFRGREDGSNVGLTFRDLRCLFFSGAGIAISDSYEVVLERAYFQASRVGLLVYESNWTGEATNGLTLLQCQFSNIDEIGFAVGKVDGVGGINVTGIDGFYTSSAGNVSIISSYFQNSKRGLYLRRGKNITLISPYFEFNEQNSIVEKGTVFQPRVTTKTGASGGLILNSWGIIQRGSNMVFYGGGGAGTAATEQLGIRYGEDFSPDFGSNQSGAVLTGAGGTILNYGVGTSADGPATLTLDLGENNSTRGMLHIGFRSSPDNNHHAIYSVNGLTGHRGGVKDLTLITSDTTGSLNVNYTLTADNTASRALLLLSWPGGWRSAKMTFKGF